MAENYVIPENPRYDPNIRALQDTDPARASTVFNPVLQQMIINTHVVKKAAETNATGVTEAKETANEALEAATNAGSAAGEAQGTANEAVEAANAASQSAGSAATSAAQAQQAAQGGAQAEPNNAADDNVVDADYKVVDDDK